MVENIKLHDVLCMNDLLENESDEVVAAGI